MQHSNAKCSFCRKTSKDAGPLVEGADSVYICGECSELCQYIIEQEKRRRNPSPEPSALERLHGTFSAFFKRIPPIADALFTAIQQHYQAVSEAAAGLTSPILLVGPSRASRLFAGRAISQSLGVPFAFGDQQSVIQSTNRFNSDSLFFELLNAGEFGLAAANRGMIYIDGLHDESTQRAFLNLIDGAANNALPDGLELDVERILFICGANGAGLDQIISTHGRHVEQPIMDNDLIAWGMLPNFVNRLHLALWWNPLDEETLVRIVSKMELKSRKENDA